MVEYGKNYLNIIFYDFKKDNITTIQLGNGAKQELIYTSASIMIFFPDEVAFSLPTERSIVEFCVSNMKRQS